MTNETTYGNSEYASVPEFANLTASDRMSQLEEERLRGHGMIAEQAYRVFEDKMRNANDSEGFTLKARTAKAKEACVLVFKVGLTQERLFNDNDVERAISLLRRLQSELTVKGDE